MARKKQKDEARRLYQKSLCPPDIADQLGVPLRTVQRWVKEFSAASDINKNEQESDVTDVIKTSDFLIEASPSKRDLPNRDWFENANNLSNELLETHTKIRRKLVDLIQCKLNDEDLNLRLIQTLSQAICRHSELERVFASLELLDINKSFKRLEIAGFLVLDPQEQTSQLND